MGRKGKNRGLVILLALAMIITTLPVTAFASAGWDGEVKTKPSLVDGVYQISNGEELAWFASEVNDGDEGEVSSSANGILTENIDLNNMQWTAIGNYENPFTGSFDGNGKKIEKLNIVSTEARQGLFGQVGQAGSVSNIADCTGTVNGTGNMTGAIVGQNYGTVENCSSKVAVSTNSGSTMTLGGIVGQNNGTVTKCVNMGNVSSKDAAGGRKNQGGIVGYNYGIISGCVNLGNIEGHSEAVAIITYMGGISGNSDSNTKIYNCYNTGNVTANESSTNSRVAGITGRLGANGILINCYNAGILTGADNVNTSGYSTKADIYSKNGSPDTAVGENNYFIAETTDADSGALSDGDLKGSKVVEDLNKDNAQGIVISDDIKYVANNGGYPKLSYESAKEAETPVPVTKVTITGTAKTGETLEAVPLGDNDEKATNVTYKWQYEEISYDDLEMDYVTDYIDIEGANSKTFTIPDNYAEKKIRVVVSGEESSTAISELTSEILKGDGALLAEAKEKLKSPFSDEEKEAKTVELPSSGENGTTITWTSDNPTNISNSGVITLPETGTVNVKMTATISLGEKNVTKEFTVKVLSEEVQSDLGVVDGIIESNKYGALTPAFGVDTNINDYVMTKSGNPEGVTVTVKTTSDTNYIKSNGDINYFYADIDSGGVTSSNKYKQVTLTLEITKGETTKTLEKKANIYWDMTKLKADLNKYVFDVLTNDAIKGDNTDLSSVTENLKLPRYLNGKYNCEITWTSSDSEALEIKAETTDWNSDYIAVPKRAVEDKAVKLYAKIKYNFTNNEAEENEINKMVKEYDVTVAAFGEDTVAEMQKQLDDNYTVNKLKYSNTDTVIDADNVTGDIQLLTASKTGITDASNYKFTVSSSDEKLAIISGYKANIYRPLPGEAAKQVTLTVTMTKTGTALKATKDITLTIKPLVQEDIDKEIALMEKVKASYFDGIKGENTDKNNITKDMHAFQEVRYADDGQTIQWVYTYTDKKDIGIKPDDLDGAELQEAWRVFRSSNNAVIHHENLLFTQPQYDSEVTIDSCLTSMEYGKYAKLYPENEDFKKLYKQPVSVTVTAKGTDGVNSNPDAKIDVNFEMNANKTNGRWIGKTKYSVKQGATAMDVTSEMLKSKGYTVKGNGSYIVSITSPSGVTLGEGVTGPNSGWMYKINGTLGAVMASDYVLKDGDTITWFYTDDYTAENYGEYVPTDNGSSTENNSSDKNSADKSLADKVISQIAAIGTTSYSSASKSKIDEARKAYNSLTEAQKKLVTNYSLLTKAETKYVELKKADEQKKAAALKAAKTKFSKSKFVLSYKSAAYTGKSKKPSVKVTYKGKKLKKNVDFKVSYKNNKNIGAATVTITGKGNYSGTKKLTFKINPKKETIKKLKSGKGKLTIKWGKDSKVTGYQIYVAKNKKFTKKLKKTTIKKYKLTTRTVTKLSKKTKYYVKVRSYKVVKGKKYYGGWSKVKTVKIK